MSNPSSRKGYVPGASRKPAPAATVSAGWDDPTQLYPLVILCVLTLTLIAAYGNMLWETSFAWFDAQYSHGYLIPLFSLVLLWLRRRPFEPARPLDRWIGLGILMVGLGVRIAASMIYSHPLDRLSFIVALFGVFLMVGGWNLIRWSGPALAFLVFMFPLPSKIENTFLVRLQTLATVVSKFVFQTLGFDVVREGNSLWVAGEPLNIAEACSGLRMATIFVALAVAIVMLVERPWWDKLIILLSAIPIALTVNVIRITITGLLLRTSLAQSETFTQYIHDVAGYVMPIMALGFLWLELAILSKLTITEDASKKAAIGVVGKRSGGTTQGRRRGPAAAGR